jgi:hypothetical protein
MLPSTVGSNENENETEVEENKLMLAAIDLKHRDEREREKRCEELSFVWGIIENSILCSSPLVVAHTCNI